MIRARKTMVYMQKASRELGCKSVLEIGCGNGSWTAQLVQLFEHVDAFDVAPSNVAQALRVGEAHIFTADAATYVPTRRYDLIVMTELLEHLLEPETVLNRFLLWCRYAIVSCPIHEDLNPDGAFNLARLQDVRQAGDTTGHIWSMDYDGFLTLCQRSNVVESCEAGTSGLALLRGTLREQTPPPVQFAP
jgi:SAM-dependent methyltransferase